MKPIRTATHQEKVNKIVQVCYKWRPRLNIMLGAMVDIADGRVLDCICEAKNVGVYRHDVKKAMNDARNFTIYAQRMFVRDIAKDFVELYYEVLDNAKEGQDKELNNLEHIMETSLAARGVKNAKLMAKCETLHWQLHFCCGVFLAFCKAIQRDVNIMDVGLPDICRTMHFIDPTNAFNAWERVCAKVCTYPSKVYEEVMDSKAIRDAKSRLERKYDSFEYFNSVAEKACEACADIIDAWEKEHPESVEGYPAEYNNLKDKKK